MKDVLRLFTAIPIHDGLAPETASSLQAAIKRTRIGAERREMEIGWVPSANFHVTLCFLGATPRERLDELKHLIANVSKETAPLETSLRGMGAFPDERHMRVLWVGVRKSRALGELQERLRAALVEAGFEQEERDYTPHLTIGRTRKARSASDLLSPYARTSFGDVAVDSVVLYESAMQGPHPIYHPLERFPLTGQRREIEVEE